MRFISMLLCFLLLVNPIMFEAAAWAEDAQENELNEQDRQLDDIGNRTNSAVSQTSEANATLQNTKKIKKPLFGRSKVKKANKKIAEAKVETAAANKEAKEGKAQADAATKDVKKTIGDQAAAAAGTTFGAMTKAASGVQKALIKTGQMLQKIGKMLKTVGQVLSTIGKVLSAIPWTSAIGAMLTKIGALLTKIGTALDYAGQAIEKIGQTAADADANFGDMLSDVFEAGKEGWKKGGEDAEAFEKKLDDEAAKADTQANMNDGSETTEADTGADAETVNDDAAEDQEEAITDM